MLTLVLNLTFEVAVNWKLEIPIAVGLSVTYSLAARRKP
ncbi:hypothetical protein KIS1582_3742 [Cytobacillus firmus]|uniref:Uncharacterized protein n=1 Tax=Cytobacillus firmus TaxID=1399 RepID=A0A800MUI2_CYTFI|nr:hypothetical protein KIS1582_3742 [Cytobacillus firmus]